MFGGIFFFSLSLAKCVKYSGENCRVPGDPVKQSTQVELCQSADKGKQRVKEGEREKER